MMTDNYLDMKEILNIWIFNYIISDYLWSYGDHSISTFIYLFIYLSIYLSIYLFDTSHQSSFSVFSKSLSPDKTSTSEPLSGGVFLTLHYHMHIINNRTEEIQAKIL